MSELKILVIGAGYVGLTTAACFAKAGNTVFIHDKDHAKLESIREGRAHFFEKGLDALVHEGMAGKTLVPIARMDEGFADSDIILVCVGTPSNNDGSVDMAQVQGACQEIGGLLATSLRRKTIAIRSTVPPGTAFDAVEAISKSSGKPSPGLFGVVSNPEFLRQGSAIGDFLDKTPAIIGSGNQEDISALRALYATVGKEITVMPEKSAEMAKYISNCFNATKVAFMNEMGGICKGHGVDVNEITDVLYPGMRYRKAGSGFGGSCLEKDVRAVVEIAKSNGAESPLLECVLAGNERACSSIARILERRLGGIEGRRIGILGLSYKKGTDDVRNSFAITAITSLKRKGAIIRATDPKSIGAMAKLIGDIGYDSDARKVVGWSEAVIILTDWEEFDSLDYSGKVVVDGRCHSGTRGKDHEGIFRP